MSKDKNILKAAVQAGAEPLVKRVEIKRIDFRDKQTEGVMTVYDGDEVLFQCYTLELEEDKNAKRDDCIPRGKYNVEKRYSTKYKHHFHVQDVPNRSYILIHMGNHHFHSLGCILVGKTLTDINGDGYRDVTSSVATMNKLNKILPNTFKLIIK